MYYFRTTSMREAIINGANYSLSFFNKILVEHDIHCQCSVIFDWHHMYEVNGKNSTKWTFVKLHFKIFSDYYSDQVIWTFKSYFCHNSPQKYF